MKKPTDEQVLKRVEEWFPRAQAWWKPHHNRFEKIKEFAKASGENGQWTSDEVAARQSTNPPRITLTENLLGPFVNQVVNDIKQSDYGCFAKPKDSGADPKDAEVRQGLHRGVHQIGGFKAALDQAADDLVTGGLGCFRFITDFADRKSFQKEFQFLEVDPPRMFHGDGTHRKRNFSDVTDSLVYEPYSDIKFKAEFGRESKEFLGRSNCCPVWGQGNTPWVSDYFFQDDTPEILAMCIDRKERYVSDIKDALKEPKTLMPIIQDHQDLVLRVQLGEALTVDDLVAKDDKTGEPITRASTRCQIWWCKLAGKEVLQVEAWPGLWIPNFVATGRKVGVRGEIKYFGLPEPAVGVQRAHNYAFSAMVERTGKASKVRTYAALESIPLGFQGDWDGIATSNKEILYYNAYREGDDRPLPPPQQSNPIQTDPAFADLRAMTEQGIRNVLGMWESALGARSNEKSGVAIQTRERQADTGNYDWGANLGVAAEHCFAVTDEVLNKVIDVPTQVRIVGEDDKESVIWAASLEENDPNPNGYYDLNRGKYNMVFKMSPSADTKRDEQSRGMESLFQGDPEMRTVLAPEYIALQPWKGADKMSKIAASYRALKLPGISDGEEKQTQLPPEAQQQIQQMHAQMQAMQEQLQQAQQAQQENQQLKIENQSVKADKQIEARRLEIEQFKADTDRMKAQADGAVKQGGMLLKADEQQHDQAIENATLVQNAHAQTHQHDQDTARLSLDADGHEHKKAHDAETLGQAERLANLKVSQQGKPTGATGKSADTGRKTVNP